jgi:hypothetical protein
VRRQDDAQTPYNESLKYVVTPHAASLSWLVRALLVACRLLFDSMTKFELVGRLGNAAHRYPTTQHPRTVDEGVVSKPMLPA